MRRYIIAPHGSPAITRRRRPFLAPLWLILLGRAVMAAHCLGRLSGRRYDPRGPGATARQGARHDRRSAASPRRARRGRSVWRTCSARPAAAGALDAIYVSDDRRAQQTAAPLAERLQRAPVVFSAGGWRRGCRAGAARTCREHRPRDRAAARAGADAAGARGCGARRGAGRVRMLIYVVSIPSFGRAQVLRLKLLGPSARRWVARGAGAQRHGPADELGCAAPMRKSASTAARM